MGKNRIVFISNAIIPRANIGGGSVVIYRHLKRFQNEGYDVLVIGLTHAIQMPESEFPLYIIQKKWWYPPLRRKTEYLTQLRIWFSYIAVSRQIKFKSNDIILAVLGDYSNLLALKIATKHEIPFNLFFHDDDIFNKYAEGSLLTQRFIQKIFKTSHCIFAVSKPMIELLKSKGAKKVELLYPIPDGNKIGVVSSWKERYSENIYLGYAGTYFNDLHFDILKDVTTIISESQNSKLYLISSISEESKRELSELTCFEQRDSFHFNNELFEFSVNELSTHLVFYSFKPDTELRMFTSFPSKFTEYVHLGIPVLIIAPTYSSIGKWAIENNWLAYIGNYSIEELTFMIMKLRSREFWENCSKQSLQIAKSQFSPVDIHTILLDNMDFN